MKTALWFTNFSNEDFVGVWDTKPKTFKAGKSILLPEYLAKHHAKHLIDRELNKLNIKTNSEIDRGKMLEKCVGKEKIDADNDLDLEIEMMNNIRKPEIPINKEEEFEELKDLKNDTAQTATSEESNLSTGKRGRPPKAKVE